MKYCLETVHKYVHDARSLFKALDGVFNVYKPPDMYYNQMRETIISNLCRDLNNIPGRPIMKHVAIEGETNKEMKVVVRDSYADHPLVVGPRYQVNDFRLAAMKIMNPDVSGVVVCGINRGNRVIHELKQIKCTRFYRVKGLLGQATDTYFHTGKIVEKTTYKHVRRGHIDRICSSMQSSHQRKMFELCGVDMQSQAAYDLAVKGPLRPADPNVPMIYTIKCVEFSPPHFALEIVCVNEDDMYLKTIIHELGMQLHSTATCTQVLCIQDGLFTINNALLPKHWSLKNIIENMYLCQKLIRENEEVLSQDSPALLDPTTDTQKIPTEERL
ncbi:pseudouridylate synthase TRUB2, mitochondrial [Megachile rotundata]|uniref:pseudouridylate synthase TRUB2, mitochondrial n=1 Tax=Megachile rotundata TaxID=143995 RepID=UPI000258D8D5|nr:PREDICTED: probable tRNA pseudouridine synthase 2 [Megachile rotundata]